jgi:hypothetical protein
MDGYLLIHVSGALALEALTYASKRDTLVCGGRDYKNTRQVWGVLRVLQPSRVIEGGARGADTLAREWAITNSVPYRTFPADWDKHGKSAGAIRNNQMVVEGQPRLVVAFPGGPGTANMVRLARTAGIPVLEISR